MDGEPPLDPERLFAGEPGAIEAYRDVLATLEALGPFEVRTTRTQVAFRRRRGFAYLWIPVDWARLPGVAVVLSVAMGRRVDSPRWKQVAHPAPAIWMHHLEVHSVDDLDDEVASWLAEAHAGAA
jgi:hypothetical protein